MSLIRVFIAGLLACSASSALAAPPTVEVTTCGQAVPRKTIGYLTSDLDCTGFDGGPGAVLLNKNATLELRGFRITGGIMNVMCGELRPGFMGQPTLYSVRRCALVGGGGTLSNAEAHGMAGDRVTVSDVTIENPGQVGLQGNKVHATNVVVTGTGDAGIMSYGTATVIGAQVSGSGKSGVAAKTLRISDSTVLGSAAGPNCRYSYSCADLFSARRPRVIDTQCGTSLGSGHPFYDWDVCASD